jgi:hypothetical protein
MWRILSCVQFRTSGLRRQALPKAELSGGCSSCGGCTKGCTDAGQVLDGGRDSYFPWTLWTPLLECQVSYLARSSHQYSTYSAT